MTAHGAEAFVQLLGQVEQFPCVVGQDGLAPAEGRALQDAEERHRRGEGDAAAERVVQQFGVRELDSPVVVGDRERTPVEVGR